MGLQLQDISLVSWPRWPTCRLWPWPCMASVDISMVGWSSIESASSRWSAGTTLTLPCGDSLRSLQPLGLASMSMTRLPWSDWCPGEAWWWSRCSSSSSSSSSSTCSSLNFWRSGSDCWRNNIDRSAVNASSSAVGVQDVVFQCVLRPEAEMYDLLHALQTNGRSLLCNRLKKKLNKRNYHNLQKCRKWY